MVNGLFDLIDDAPIFGFPLAPLLSIDGTKVTVFISPFVPDSNTVFLEVFDVRIALEEPKQFMNNGT